MDKRIPYAVVAFAIGAAAVGLKLRHPQLFGNVHYTVITECTGTEYVTGDAVFRLLPSAIEMRSLTSGKEATMAVQLPAVRIGETQGTLIAAANGDLYAASALPGKPATAAQAPVGSRLPSQTPGPVIAPTFPHPNAPKAPPKSAFDDISRMKWVGSFRGSNADLTPGSGLKAKKLSALPVSGTGKTPTYNIAHVAVQNLNVTIVNAVQTPVAVISGSTLITMQDVPDIIVQTNNGKQYWNCVIGRSSLTLQQLASPASAPVVIRKGISDFVPIYAVTGGFAWIENQPYPDKTSLIYIARSSDGATFNCGPNNSSARTGMAAVSGEWAAWGSGSTSITEGLRVAKVNSEITLCRLVPSAVAGEPGTGKQYHIAAEGLKTPDGEELQLRDWGPAWHNGKLYCLAQTVSQSRPWYDQQFYLCRVHLPDEGKPVIERISRLPDGVDNVQLNDKGIWFQIYPRGDERGGEIKNVLARMDWPKD